MLPVNHPYKAFLNRILATKAQPIHPDLGKLISKSDLDSIIEYIEKNEFIHNSICGENKGFAKRFSKEETGLARTFHILRGLDGEFALIVDTKSKLADHTKLKPHKQILPKVSGVYKDGKPAWRVDGKQEEFFNQINVITNDIELNGVIEEAIIGKLINSERVNTYLLGQQFIGNEKRIKISLFSPKAQNDLETFLKAHPFLESIQRNILISDLLNGVKAFHENGYVHQDIKPSNLLIYTTGSSYRLKLTDYGHTRKQTDLKAFALASVGFNSPEISYVYCAPTPHAAPSTKLYNLYNSDFGQSTLGNIQFLANPKMFPPNNDSKKVPFRTPHMANDMWAIGIIIFIMLYDRFPNQSDFAIIQSNALLKGLLESDRAKRLTIDDAIKLHQQQSKEEDKVKQILSLPLDEFIKKMISIDSGILQLNPAFLPSQTIENKRPYKDAFVDYEANKKTKNEINNCSGVYHFKLIAKKP